MRRLVCAAVVLGCLSRLASAEDGKKDETTAALLSLSAGVLLPAGLIAAIDNSHGGSSQLLYDATVLSVMVGPTVGHWYAGRAWTNATTIRLIAGVTGLYGLVIAVSSDCDSNPGDPPSATDSCESNGKAAGVVAMVSLGAIIGSTAYDVITASRSAREYNARHLVVTPVTMPGPPGGHTAIGFGIGGTF